MRNNEKPENFKYVHVPLITLSNGDQVPAIGFGTFGSDSVPAGTVAETVKKAIYSGYRQIDCASVYGNEKNIGNVLKEIFESDFLKREDLWITSKVWNDISRI